MAAAIAAKYVAVVMPFVRARADGADRWDVKSLSNELDVLGMRVRLAIPRTVGPLFDRMANSVDKANWRAQSTLYRQGALLPVKVGDLDQTLRQGIAQARERNIRLVEDAQRVYAAQVRRVVEDPDNFGLRVEDVAKKLRERGDVSESRAELIARDQTLKLNGQITGARQVAAGVEKYTWSTSLDERVREEHEALEGQVFGWDSPPEVGHPGQDFQCRCVAIAVIDELEELF